MSDELPTRSRLPDDPAYWESLARRSAAAAFSVQPPVRLPPQPWWHALSHAAAVLAAGAVIALAGGSLLLDARAAPSTAAALTLTNALAPEDPLLRTLIDASVEPQPETLLGLIVAREAER